jgi:uncharacterized protein
VILYLHGFNSTPGSLKARTLRTYMKARGLDHLFACPELPHRPQEALHAIEMALGKASAQATTLVGSSLGGFYATYVAEKHGCRAVLIQPAVSPYVGLATLLGTQQNLYTGERYQLTREHLDAWRALAVERVDPERYLVLLETGDEVLDWREAALKYAGARMVIRDGGDHTLRSFPEHIPRILAFAGIVPRG